MEWEVLYSTKMVSCEPVWFPPKRLHDQEAGYEILSLIIPVPLSVSRKIKSSILHKHVSYTLLST